MSGVRFQLDLGLRKFLLEGLVLRVGNGDERKERRKKKKIRIRIRIVEEDGWGMDRRQDFSWP